MDKERDFGVSYQIVGDRDGIQYRVRYELEGEQIELKGATDHV